MIGKIPEIYLDWSNQRQEDSISYKKVLLEKRITCMEMIGILPRYNTMKGHLQSMSGTLLGTCRNMSAKLDCMYFLGKYCGKINHKCIYKFSYIPVDMFRQIFLLQVNGNYKQPKLFT